ncbi:hypothetical protein D3C76_1602360 [compost metagenome]
MLTRLARPEQPLLYLGQWPPEFADLGLAEAHLPKPGIVAGKQGDDIPLEVGQQARCGDRTYASHRIQRQPQGEPFEWRRHVRSW